jgi:hypothetical protein
MNYPLFWEMSMSLCYLVEFMGSFGLGDQLFGH